MTETYPATTATDLNRVGDLMDMAAWAIAMAAKRPVVEMSDDDLERARVMVEGWTYDGAGALQVRARPILLKAIAIEQDARFCAKTHGKAHDEGSA